jgi:hypothetical protein
MTFSGVIDEQIGWCPISTLLRVVVTLLLILALGVVVMIFAEQQVIVLATFAGVAVVIVLIWMLGNQMVKEAMQGANNPARIDREAKRLVELIIKNFNEDGVGKIGAEAQTTIVANMRKLKSGKIKSPAKAAKALAGVPTRKFAQTRDIDSLSATLARYYLLADDKTDDGERARMRINNFIAGISDSSL